MYITYFVYVPKDYHIMSSGVLVLRYLKLPMVVHVNLDT